MTIVKSVEDVVWVTKEGKEIPIKNLEDNHLYNCIKMLENNAKKWHWK